MPDTQTNEWIGKSGRAYRYTIYPLPTRFSPGQPGNYVFAKRDADGHWTPLYIGQGDLNDRAIHHHQAQCLRVKGATHFHCHKAALEQHRRREEIDLLLNPPQAYQPAGCNETPVG